MDDDGRGESILTDVLKQSWGLELLEPRRVPVVAATPLRIAGQQPLRQLLLVVADDAATMIFLAPNSQALTAAVSRVGTGTPPFVHSATFPLLVSYPWWVVASANDTLTVYDVVRQSAESL